MVERHLPATAGQERTEGPLALAMPDQQLANGSPMHHSAPALAPKGVRIVRGYGTRLGFPLPRADVLEWHWAWREAPFPSQELLGPPLIHA
eukprot:14575168-Alexandrium_andersonii.AAC.1